jgi:hypothetical protein
VFQENDRSLLAALSAPGADPESLRSDMTCSSTLAAVSGMPETPCAQDDPMQSLPSAVPA